MPVVKIQPTLNINDLLCFFGGQTGRQYSNALKNKMHSWQKRFNAIIDPRLYYQINEVKDISKGSVQVKQNCQFKSQKLSKTLKQCKEVVCFVATIGNRIEKEISRILNQNRLSEAYILDAMGSVTVENLAEQFQSNISKDFKEKGKTVTLRFSPGYCDWPVTEQKKLFQLIDSQRVGVELNDSCLMTPRKSISGVFGIHSDDENSGKQYTPCSDCHKTDCPDRRYTLLKGRFHGYTQRP